MEDKDGVVEVTGFWLQLPLLHSDPPDQNSFFQIGAVRFSSSMTNLAASKASAR